MSHLPCRLINITVIVHFPLLLVFVCRLQRWYIRGAPGLERQLLATRGRERKSLSMTLQYLMTALSLLCNNNNSLR